MSSLLPSGLVSLPSLRPQITPTVLNRGSVNLAQHLNAAELRALVNDAIETLNRQEAVTDTTNRRQVLFRRLPNISCVHCTLNPDYWAHTHTLRCR